MIRELVLVSGDLTATPWFVRGAPPAPHIPSGFAVERLSDSARASLFEKGPIPAKLAAARLADGDTCLAALTAEGHMAAQMWCTERSRFIDWIGCHVRPPEGHVHVYNSWVEPEFRGLGLQWNLAAASCLDILARKRTKMCAGVERKEYPPFARKYATMGLGLVAPYKTIWSLQLFGVAVAVVPWSPPRVLDAARRSAARIVDRRGTRGDQPGGEDASHDGQV